MRHSELLDMATATCRTSLGQPWPMLKYGACLGPTAQGIWHTAVLVWTNSYLTQAPWRAASPGSLHEGPCQLHTKAPALIGS